MTKETKENLFKTIDMFEVACIITPNEIIYDIDNGEGMIMSACSLLYINKSNKPTIQYTIEVNDEIMEEENIEQGKPISRNAQDIIDIMKKCAHKILIQQATLLQNKYMHHMVHSSKEYN